MLDLGGPEPVDDTPEARLGAQLRAVRMLAGLSVRRLAKDLNRAHSTISDFENGQRLPGVEVVEEYEDYFGLSRGELGAQRERARAERLESPQDATLEENLGDVVCPYVGLRTFETADAALFFGREGQVDEVLEGLAEARFVAVVGASGSGKSSFVRAGLLTALSAAPANGGAASRVVLLTPGEHPLEALETALRTRCGAGPGALAEEARVDPDALRRATGHGDLVLVVDQFEELFTLCAHEAERRRFIDALIAVWRHPSSRVIIALRADFYGYVADYPELAVPVVAYQTLTGPLSPADLRRAIELPAAASGLLLQVGLADTMLEDLAGEPGALPLLSHALLETWKRRRRLMLTIGAYREAGGVRGAIAQTAEHTLQSLSEAEQAVARSIFLSLTDIGEGSDPTRRRIDREELAAGTEATQRDRVLGILADARLVTVEERTVTVAHEALVRHWPRMRSWIEADHAGLLLHRRLTAAAREWDTLDREPAALYRGARLAAAREWATAHASDLNALERAFLTASEATEHHDQVAEARKNERLEELLAAAKHRERRLRILTGGLGALMAVVGALMVWAIGQRNDAKNQATETASLALVSSANSVISSRLDISLLLAREAYRASPRSEAQSSVLRALIAARNVGIMAILRGHTDAVLSVAFSRDRRILASGGSDGTVRLWDMRTHKPVGAPVATHAGRLDRVALSSRGRTVASVGEDGAVRLWDMRTHMPLGASLPRDKGSVESLEFSPDGRTLVTASARFEGSVVTARRWDVITHRSLGSPLICDDASDPALSRDGRTLATDDGDGRIRVWNLRTHTLRGAPLRPTGIRYGLALSPNGHIVAIAGSRGTISLWNVRTHRPLGPPLNGHNSGGFMAFSPDGRTLASTRRNGTIELWDVRTHQLLGEPLGTHLDLSSVAFSPDARTLVSAGADGTIRLWDLAAHVRPVARPTSHRTPELSVAFSPDRRILASAGEDGTIRLWDRAHRLLGAPLTGHKGTIYGVAFSPDARILASAGEDGTIRLWDVHAHQLIGTLLGRHKDRVLRVEFSPDSRIIAAALERDPIRLPDVRTRKRRGLRQTIRLWDVRMRKPVGSLTYRGTGSSGIVFSPDHRTLVSAGYDGMIRFWDVRAQKLLGARRAAHRGGVWSVAFSADGHTLASAGDDGTIELWDARAQEPLPTLLRGPRRIVVDLAFSPDGRNLAAAIDGGTIRLWNVPGRKALGMPLTAHKRFLLLVRFSSDGRSLVGAGTDGTIWVWKNILWRTETELQNAVCRFVGNGLSRIEWARYAASISYRPSCR
jgi:WD40 repeat protein/transcriptional regulator with XRE-family HTH domain